jgi:uncharacterized protein YfiM (DUF2279 family)
MGVKANPGGTCRSLYSGPMRLPVLLYALGSLAVSAPCFAQEAETDRWLARDKPVHALAAGWVAGAAYAAGIEREWDPADRRRAAVAAALAVSLAKEGVDAWTEGEPFSFKDLTADVVGIAAFVTASALADR